MAKAVASSFYLKSGARVAPATNASRSGGAEMAKSLQKWKLPEQKGTAEVAYVLHKQYHMSDLLFRRCGNRVTFRNWKVKQFKTLYPSIFHSVVSFPTILKPYSPKSKSHHSHTLHKFKQVKNRPTKPKKKEKEMLSDKRRN